MSNDGSSSHTGSDTRSGVGTTRWRNRDSGVEPGGDVPPELVERRQRPLAGPLEHEHLARVPADHAALELEDPSVLAAQPLNDHRMPP